MLQEYINLDYKPNKSEIICEYYIEPSQGFSFEEVVTNMAGESSIDTWAEISTLSPQTAKRLKPHVFFMDKKRNIAKIAYHSELFETCSVPQILSSIAGNIFSMKLLSNLKLLDISFPNEVIKEFRGPKYGLEGVRKITKVANRPLIGTIVKPKVGLTTEKHALVAYNSWFGGCDLVKEDENLTNQKFNPFQERIKLSLKMKEKAEKETGERKMYLANITAPTTEEMIKRAKFVSDNGGEYIMVDIIPVGWSALQSLRKANEDLKLVLHAHRCMHSAITRNEKHGVSMQVIAKLTRLIGLDQIHIGTVTGKMHGDKNEVLAIRDGCIQEKVKENDSLRVLSQNWEKIKPVFPVASGGLHPLMIPELYRIFGNDIIMQFGGGIHAHPGGTIKGARACRQALDAVMNNVSLEKAAEEKEELRKAIKQWG
ncbi:MAG: type III ribulose-bisphosphate carboxylase [archaeon]